MSDGRADVRMRHRFGSRPAGALLRVHVSSLPAVHFRPAIRHLEGTAENRLVILTTFDAIKCLFLI